MHNEEDNTKMIFTRQRAWMGFFAYLIGAAIIAAVYIVG